MIEATPSYLAWFSVVLFQAILHFWILDSRKRMEEEVSTQSAVVESNEANEIKNDPPEIETSVDDEIPHMVPHTPVSEDEDEDESFDGDEPKVFFELLEQTGSEMMKVCEYFILRVICYFYNNIISLQFSMYFKCRAVRLLKT
jgi:hypothetical protein